MDSKITYKQLMKMEAKKIASLYLKLTRSTTSILEYIMSMKRKYSWFPLIPRQITIAKAVGCSLCTVNRALKRLAQLNIITKRSRGWRIVSPETNTFKSNTCFLNSSPQLKKDMWLLTKFLPKNTPILGKLISRIPSLKCIIPLFAILTNIYSLKMNMNINNKYIRNETTISFYKKSSFQDNLNHKVDLMTQTCVSLPTSTLPITSKSTNTFGERPTVPVQYTIQTQKSESLKFKSKDLRFCTEENFKYLNDYDKQIASRYFTGKKMYGSIEEYDCALEKLSQSGRPGPEVFTPVPKDYILSTEEIAIIKAFPSQAVYYVKTLLQQHPCKKNDFNWIYITLINYSKMNNLDIKDLLKKYNFNYQHLYKTYEPNQFNTLYPYKTFKPQTNPQQLDSTPVDNTKINPNFLKLIGETAYNEYLKRTGLTIKT